MREINADLSKEFLNDRWDAICCTINTVVGTSGLVMGAGVARIFKERFQWLPYIWGERITRWRLPRTFIIVTPIARGTDERTRYAIGFPTKRDYRCPSELNLIKRSALQLHNIIEALDWKNVLLPRPGCANGGLSWEQVKPILDPILDDRVTIISKD